VGIVECGLDHISLIKSVKEILMRTIEDYFRTCNSLDIIDHSLRVSISNNEVKFYIHPTYVSGDTMAFVVNGNMLGTKIDLES
jgi:hypothetical protein